MNLCDALQSVDLDDLIKRLTLYASSRLRSVGVKDFDGKEPVDFVGDLFLKVMEGTRDWEKANCSFTEFMFGCLKSELSNFFNGTSIGQTQDLQGIELDSGQNDFKEEREQVSELLKRAGADDNELLVFEYWLDGIYKPAEIAGDLGIDVKEIYVITKRLERRLPKIRVQAKSII
ncbi:sigma-70 family RNA polymerase sigma factor [Parapedobacter sp. ISTM3]|uniref:sigma-70 family RNA polymerase sigma factor n=1 Tax=Parapedobacter sp. ISTM3 TaxID=2800130 RepID=UPI001908BEFA|nr:sigma-70 family RNA polymerase sigma factor [Parapedobacter sp. ISTM3]MBK1439975.1 sigma-70 family RNA polymerase sigma factor [Parapedobacter sp. ISTM3]